MSWTGYGRAVVGSAPGRAITDGRVVHYATMRVVTDAADQAKLDPDRISHKNTVRVIRSRIWIPGSFPPGQE